MREAQSFQDIYEVDYFLAVSLFMNASVSVNMGQHPFVHFNTIVGQEMNAAVADSEAVRRYADKIEPYWSLCQADNLKRFGVFQIKEEKIEDY